MEGGRGWCRPQGMPCLGAGRLPVQSLTYSKHTGCRSLTNTRAAQKAFHSDVTWSRHTMSTFRRFTQCINLLRVIRNHAVGRPVSCGLAVFSGVFDSGTQCSAEHRKAGVDPVLLSGSLSLRFPLWFHLGTERNTHCTQVFHKEIMIRHFCCCPRYSS